MKSGRAFAPTRIACTLLSLAAVPCAALGDWNLGVDARLYHDDNVGNAQSRPDIVEDSVIGARLSIFQLFPLDDAYSLTVGGELGGERFHRVTGLGSASLSGAVSIRRKWGLGAFVPWARAGVSLGRLDYDDSYRNAWVYQASLAAGRRFDERWNLWADYVFERRAASTQEQEVPGLSGDAYSQTSHSAALHVEYSLNDSTFLALALLGRHGDVVSTTSGSEQIFEYSRALAEDPAFGPEAYAYRLTGTTVGFRVGIDWSPTDHCALGIGFERLDTRADGGNDYTKSVPEITWDYRF